MIYRCRDFPGDLLTEFPVLPRKQGKRIGKNRRKYLNVVCAFDIETTRISEDFSVMYIWQLQIGPNYTIIGRSWREFKIAVQRLISGMEEDVYIVVYVHNLAFEFQFLRGIYDFKPEEVFAVQPRRPLRVDMWDHLELRCSYLHSNMRLETYLKKMGVPDQKLTYDYEKKRFPWTPLTDQEIAYCINDVKGLVEAVMVEMLHDEDTLYSIPATSTGYVRRDVKLAMRRLRYGVVKDMLPDIDTYHLLREAFRGGNTHSNRYYSGYELDGVYSWDRSSSYPDVQVNCPFPIGRFYRLDWKRIPWEKLEDMIYRRKKAVLARLAFWNIELADPFNGCPYIPRDKCRHVVGERCDNGRILSADYLEITVTDVDFRILVKQYTFKARRVLTLEHARYGQLPDVLKRCIISYYRLKTELKGIPDQALLYEKSKNKLNSIYGMSAQNPVKQNILWTAHGWELDQTPIEELLEASNKKAFFPYQWGVWTTAWARYRLQEGIDLVTDQGGDFVYCDTDSVKYMGDVDWTAYNEARQADSTRNGAFADDPKGRRHYMGVYEPDSGYPAKFATRGAKKYVVQHPDGKLEATIAGVSKREDGGRISGGMELEKHGGIDAFLLPEFTFREAGGIELAYNDSVRKMIRIDGHRLKIRECVTIRPSTYTLSDTEEYSGVLATAAEIREFMFDAFGKRF